MPLTLGDHVEDFSFVKPDGSVVRLRDFLGKPLLLIFLRHLA